MNRFYAAARDAVGEEPIAAGARLMGSRGQRPCEMKMLLPPLVTLSDEEPIATGGRCF